MTSKDGQTTESITVTGFTATELAGGDRHWPPTDKEHVDARTRHTSACWEVGFGRNTATVPGHLVRCTPEATRG